MPRWEDLTQCSPLAPGLVNPPRCGYQVLSSPDTWLSLGKVEEEAFIPIVVGGDWPSKRQAWCVIHRPDGHTLRVTDGPSDPFYLRTEPSTGFGLELALETNEPLGNVEKSWPPLLLERVSTEVAGHAHLRERLMTGSLSMEVAGAGWACCWTWKRAR